MTSHARRGRALATGLTLLTAAALVAGCSSSGTPSSAAGPTAGSTPGTSTATTKAPPKARPASVTAPTVSAPVTGGKYGKPFNPVPKAVADRYGYQEHEYFITGQATSYKPTGPWGADGVWGAAPDATAPFTTREIVRLPTDPARFNGTVLVEWLNVSAGMDSDPDWSFAHDELMRSGFGYIGVSAQFIGINGGTGKLPIPGFTAQALKEWDPQRYAELSHPGDQFSYDIYTQAAATALDPPGTKPFAGYDVQHILAAGESQSASRLTTYVNAIHPSVELFDEFLVHSRGGSGAALAPDVPAPPKVTAIRTDLAQPVFQLETETDLFGLGFHPARQPDTAKLRTWELAGTSHADQFTLDAGVASGHEWDPNASIDFSGTCGTINNGPQTYLVRALVASLQRWVVDGTLPPPGDPITVADGKIVRDADGNALGGLRTAAVDAPTSQLSGEQASSSSVICSLFGFTKPFTAEQLAAHYPTHADYVAKVRAATQRAVDRGFVLAADQPEIIATAEAAKVP